MKYRLREVIDKLHDHSFRIRRPDTSVKLGTPNACNDCHADQSAQWAADTIEQWHGPTRNGFQNCAEAFQASWTGRSDAAAQLMLAAARPTTPAIARASALSELHSRVSPASIELAGKGLADPDPMVRNAALDMLDGHPGNRIWQLVSPLLTDSSCGLRIRAVSVLAGAPATRQPASDREAFERATAQFIAAQRFNTDRPEARATLGNFFVRRGLATMPRTNIKLRFGSVLNLRLRRSIWPICIGNLAGKATLRPSYGQRLHLHARTRDCTMRLGSL
jgi:hypothetical protein